MLKRGVAGLVGLGLVGGAGAAVYSDDGTPTVTIKDERGVPRTVEFDTHGKEFSCPPEAARKLSPYDIRAGRITLTLRRVRRREKAIEKRYPSRDDAPGHVAERYDALVDRDNRLVEAFNEQIERRNAIIEEECG
jgi:hypothetical protein